MSGSLWNYCPNLIAHEGIYSLYNCEWVRCISIRDFLKLMAPCKACFRRRTTLRKQKETHKPMEEFKSIAFGEHLSGNRESCNYRVRFIRIWTAPYCGIVKCNATHDTRVRCSMPLVSRSSMLTDVLPKLKDPPFSHQLAIDDIYKSPISSSHIIKHFYHFHFLISKKKLVVQREGKKVHGTPRKIQSLKFGQYHLDLRKHPDNIYALHICGDGKNQYGIRSCFISMSFKTWDDFINQT